MWLLRDMVDAKATPNQRAAFLAEEWCRRNSGWVRICDIPSAEFERKAYRGWESLTAEEQHSWFKNFQQDAESAWLQWGRTYKVPTGYIMDDGTFLYIDQWRQMDLRGRGFMQVLQLTAEDKAHYARKGE